jgi:hypothetical protein
VTPDNGLKVTQENPTQPVPGADGNQLQMTVETPGVAELPLKVQEMSEDGQSKLTDSLIVLCYGCCCQLSVVNACNSHVMCDFSCYVFSCCVFSLMECNYN